MVSDPGINPLPRATGYEVGFRTRQFERIEFSAAFWLLYLDSELVFVGDEGITEASDATKRLGFELFTKIKLLDWLWLRGDITEYHCRIPWLRRCRYRWPLDSPPAAI